MSQAGVISTGAGSGDVLFLAGNSGGNVGPTNGGVINVVGDGTTATVVGNPGTNTLTITALPESFVFTDEAISFNAVITNGYFVTAAATATLPASPSQGNTIQIVADTASAIVVQANTGQFIRVSNVISSSAGTATSTERGDSLILVYRASDTTWISTATNGNWLLT